MSAPALHGQHHDSHSKRPSELEKGKRREWLHELNLQPVPVVAPRPASRSVSSMCIDPVENMKAELWRDLQIHLGSKARLQHLQP